MSKNCDWSTVRDLDHKSERDNKNKKDSVTRAFEILFPSICCQFGSNKLLEKLKKKKKGSITLSNQKFAHQCILWINLWPKGGTVGKKGALQKVT